VPYFGKKKLLDRCPRCLEYRTQGTVKGQRDVLGRIACQPCRDETEQEALAALTRFYGNACNQATEDVPGDEPTEQAGSIDAGAAAVLVG